MHLQEMDYTKTFSDMTKQVLEIFHPEDLPNIVSNAFKTALEGLYLDQLLYQYLQIYLKLKLHSSAGKN